MRKMEISNTNAVNRITVEKAIEIFLRNCLVKNLSIETQNYYKENCNLFNSLINVEYIDEVTRDIVEDFIFLEKQTIKKVTTINTKLRAIRAFLYFCMEREFIPYFKVKLLKCDTVEKVPYTETELIDLLEKPKTTKWTTWRNWAIENYLLATGNRIGTARNMKIKNLDFQNNLIKLSSTKNRKQQIIPMSSALKDVLLEYLGTWEHTDEDFLFPQYEGKQMARRTLQQAISDYNKSKGITKTSAHLFRHTFAKNYVTAGGGTAKLQKLLGHSSLDMTMHYINLYGTDLAENYDQLNPLNNILSK